jgi:uncharacterized protein
MTYDATFFLAAVPAMVLLGLGKGGFAGASMLAVPILAFVMPPLQAAAIVLPVLLVQDALTVWSFRRDIDWAVLKFLVPASALGQFVAWRLAHVMDVDMVRLVVGLIAITFAVMMVIDRQRRVALAAATGTSVGLKPQDAKAATFLGSISGFASFIVHAGSPPFNVYAIARVATPVLYAGTAAIFFAFQNIIKLPSFAELGLFSMENFKSSLVLLPVAVAANLAGIWLIRRVNPNSFFFIIIALMVIAGGKLAWDGARGIL